MKIGSLFADLVIKGGEKAGQQVGAVTGGMKGLFNMSLETKAMIAGVVYGLQRMSAGSAQTGMQLQQFETITGQSAEQLQRWQWMARQAGTGADEVTNSVAGLQQKLATLKVTGEGADAFAIFSQTIGLDAERAQKDVFYLLEQLQKFSKLNLDPGMLNHFLRPLLGDPMIAFLRKNELRPDQAPKSSIIGAGQLEGLTKINAAWANLAQSIEVAFSRMNQKDVLEFIKNIEKLTVEMMKLLTALMKFSSEMGVFEKINSGIGAVSSSINDTTSSFKSGTVLKDFGAWYAKQILKFNPALLAASKAGGTGDVMNDIKGFMGDINLTQIFNGQMEPEAAGRHGKIGVTEAAKTLGQIPQ